MSSHRAGIGAASAAPLTVSVVLMVAAIGFIAFTSQSAPNPSSTESSSTSTSTGTSTSPLSSSVSYSSTICASSSQIATTSTDTFAVFNLQTMPSNFAVGDYRFVMVYNGTGY